jgi:hypothetical protein
MNAAETQTADVPESPGTPVALIVIETGGADVCAVDGTGC